MVGAALLAGVHVEVSRWSPVDRWPDLGELTGGTGMI